MAIEQTHNYWQGKCHASTCMHGTFVVLLLFPSSRESEIGGVTDKNSALKGRICYLLPL